MKIKKILISILLIAVLLLLSLMIFYTIKTRSIWLILIYPLAYFLLLYYIKNCKFWKSSKFILSVFFIINFPCLWSNGDYISISSSLFSFYDLFATNNFFFKHGPDLTESWKMNNTYVIFQVFSLMIGFMVVLKLLINKINFKQIIDIIYCSIHQNLIPITTIVVLYFFINHLYFESILGDFEGRNFMKNRFNATLSVFGIFFSLLILFKLFWKSNRPSAIKRCVIMLFILFFPIITVSNQMSHQFTDSMEYLGHFPVLTTLASSFRNILNFILNESHQDPYKENIKLLVFYGIQIFYIIIIFVPNQQKSEKYKYSSPSK